MGREDTSTLMSLRARIVAALKAEESSDKPDEVRLGTLRLIQCAVDDRDVCARGSGSIDGCPEQEVLNVLKTMVAQREISAREYDDAGRIEDAIRERDEIEVIQDFLPKPLSGKALDEAVASVVEDLGAEKLKDLGRCMNELKQRYPGLIDAGQAGKAVRAVLRG